MSTNTFSPESNILRPQLKQLPKKSHVVVVGAGAFGGWSALSLLRSGMKVTLVDAWGPGNSRSSSGDETRVIRSTYGDNAFYFDMNVRALTLWKAFEKQCSKKLFHNTGVIWFCYNEKAPVIDDSIPFAARHGMEYEYLTKENVTKRYPHVLTDDLHHAWLDPYGGYLMARECCQAVNDSFIKEGGTYVQSFVNPGKIQSGKMTSILLADGSTLHGDAYLFACGAWLGKMFPDVLGSVITCTKQEAYYFGTPRKESLQYDSMPVWVDVDGKDFYYGIPGNANRGFKIGVDRRGEPFDPTDGDHILNPDVLAHARNFISHRFPGLKGAPLVESRVCPYENSPDGNFIFEKHPEADNIIFLGGGSGHGFKHGPALGEWVVKQLTIVN